MSGILEHFQKMECVMVLFCVLTLQIPSMLSASTVAIKPLDKLSSISDSSLQKSPSSSPLTLSPTSQSTSSSSPPSTVVSSILPLGQVVTTTLSTDAQISSSISTISSTSELSSTLTTSSPIVSSSTLTVTLAPVSKTESKTVSLGTMPISTTSGKVDSGVMVGNLLQDSLTSNVSDGINVTDATTQNSANSTESSSEQTTSEQNFESTTILFTQNNVTNASDTSDTSASLSTSTSTSTTTTQNASTTEDTSSVTTSVKYSTFNSPTTQTGNTDKAASTSTMKILTSTHSSKGDKSKQSPTSCDEKGQDSSFGDYGLPVSAVALAICVIEFIIILFLMARASKRKRKRRMSDEDKATPKLKMLEIKDDTTKRSTNDDLHVYSLDYEKHVQEKIEEHKKKTKPPVAEKPIGGVSSFMLNKQPSLRSNLSSPSSPESPLSPAENKPLIKYHGGNDMDEPIVFNFAKRPSEILTKRRESAADEAGRRKSNASTGKSKVLPKDKFDTDV